MLSVSQVTLAACDLSLCHPLSPPQVVPGHRVCQRRGPHVPHAETEEASGGARQVGAGQAGGGPSSGGRRRSVGETRTPRRRHSGGSSESQSPALLLRWLRDAQLFLPLGQRPSSPLRSPRPEGPGDVSLHPPALSCFPQFSLFSFPHSEKIPSSFMSHLRSFWGEGRS